MKKLIRAIILALLCSLGCDLFAQKSINALRIDQSIKIDGKLDEDSWELADIATDFITLDPVPGNAASKNSIVKVLYDDDAIYIGAYMPDESRDSIMTELTERDDIGNTDFFAFFLDAYQKGNDGLTFVVASTGVQFDAFRSRTNEDERWDAVWKSKALITDRGWYAELRIPYAALRFPEKDIQEWNVNFGRRRAVLGETSFWNEIDPNLDNAVLINMGQLQGLKNIEPPVRLSLTPYGTTYYNHSRKPSEGISGGSASYSLGMDLKYGITDAFTLDMTLVPDFGQTQADDLFLNLGPFEIQFDENRPFFQEGFDLFSKGDIFYSRRVGGRPLKFWNVGGELRENEEVIANPRTAQLYNASKVSGRTDKGLGIGFFNAVAAETNAVIQDTITGDTRQYKTNPLTNYNVIVFDQNLANNSTISLTNTNVIRQGAEFRDANVTATEFNLKNKKQSWGINGRGVYSQIMKSGEANTNGHAYNVRLEKLQGDLVGGLFYNVESDEYNTNDLGFLRAPNSRDIGFFMRYRKFEKFGPFQQFSTWFNYEHSRLYAPNSFVSNHFNSGWWGQNKALWNFNMWYNYRPTNYDYFEPRVWGAKYERPAFWNVGGWVGTDSRKAFRMSMSSFYYRVNDPRGGRFGGNINLNPRYRVSDQFTFEIDMEIFQQNNDEGYATMSGDDIIFGRRDWRNIENVIMARYTFNDKMALDLRIRHRWDRITWNDFNELLDDGGLSLRSDIVLPDQEFNSFNLDLRYRWRFAPGSDLIFVWQSIIVGETYAAEGLTYDQKSYINGLESLSRLDQFNNISVRMLYFLDYNEILGS